MEFIGCLQTTPGFRTATTAEHWSQVLYKAFIRLDALLRKRTAGTAEERSGATAVVALVTPTDILVANAGDSRCVLGRASRAVEMSEDHKPTNLAERKRIARAGGAVALGRVNGELAVSRAMGDYG
jgi:serine/threonine protein phosphatase PrpC